MKTVGYLILDAFVYGTPAMIILLHILHMILPKKFDSIWFNRNYFSEAELLIYSSYPLSLVKTLGYAGAIGLPFIMKKRFVDLSPAQDINIFIKLLSYILFLLIFLILLAGVLSMVAFFVLD